MLSEKMFLKKKVASNNISFINKFRQKIEFLACTDLGRSIGVEIAFLFPSFGGARGGFY